MGRPYVEGGPLEGIVDVRAVDATLAELEAVQAETLRLLGKLDRRVTAQINLKANRVEVPVAHRAWFDAALREAGIRLPNNAAVVTVEDPHTDGGAVSVPGIRFPTQEPEEPGVAHILLPLEGELVERDGCLRVKREAGESVLVVWPHGYRAGTEDGRIVVLDREGRVVARVGERVEFGGERLKSGQASRAQRGDLATQCPGPYFEVNDIPAQ